MSKIESQSMMSIKRMCEEHHLNIKDTYSIMKRLLELYRNAIGYRNSITGGANAILQAEGKEEVRQWYLNLEKLTREEIRAKSIDSMIFHVCRTDWILRVIKVVMDRVKMFPEFGELYYNILQIAYFEKDKMSDQEIVEKLNLERSTYYRRKKEAILLCGVLLWDEAKHRKFA